MKPVLIGTLTFFLFSRIAFGQTNDERFSIEVSGNVLYDYSNLTYGPELGESFERFIRRHTITFQPRLGYFVTPELQLALEPHYSYRFMQYNSSQYQFGQPVKEYVYGQWTHNVGASIGPVYNYQLGSAVVLFGGILAGVSWTYFGYDPPYSWLVASPWKKPEITFPQLSGGTKIFFADTWAAVFMLQYSRTTNFNGRDDQTNAGLSLGLGLSVFL